MNPSNPTFLSKPNIHDQLRNLSAKLNEGKEIDEDDANVLNRLTKYNKLDGVKTGVTVKKNKFTDDEDVFYDTAKLSSFVEKREAELARPTSIARANKLIPDFVARVGGEMRPKSKRIEEDLKSLEKRNQKTEEGKVKALEANNRLMLEIMDSESIMTRNREEIKRLREDLSTATFDKKSLQEKLNQAEKDLKDYEEEVKKASRVIGQITAEATNKIIREDKKLATNIGIEKVRDNRGEKEGVITHEESQRIKNELVSNLKNKLLEVKSVEELDHYVALEQDKLRDIARNNNLNIDTAHVFYRDMTQDRIMNANGNPGASFDFLVNRKRSELLNKKEESRKKEPLDADDAYADWKYSDQKNVSEEIAEHNRKKAAGFSPDKTPRQDQEDSVVLKSMILNSSDSKSEEEKSKDLENDPDWINLIKTGKVASDIFNEIIRKMKMGVTLSFKELRISIILAAEINIALHGSDKSDGSKKPPVPPVTPKDPSEKKPPRKTNPKITEGDMWWATEMVRLQGQKDLETSKDESEKVSEERINELRASFEEEMNRKNEELRKKEEALLNKENELNKAKQETEKNLRDLYATFSKVGSFSSRQDEWNDILQGKKKIKKDPSQPDADNSVPDPAPVPPVTPTLPMPPIDMINAGPNTKALEQKHGPSVFKNLFIGTCLAAASFAGGNYYGDNQKKTNEIIVESYNSGYEKAKIDSAKNLLIKNPEKSGAEIFDLSTSQFKNPGKSGAELFDLAGADNKSAEVKKTENGTLYKISDYGVKGFSGKEIEYIPSPARGSKERMNNFCNLKGAGAKTFLGFNNLEDAATACLHQLWRYQTGNNKVGLSGDSTLEQMIGKYANLDKVVREDAYENYLKIIQKTFKENGQKVNENTKLSDISMSVMLEAISIAENKFYVFDAKSMTVAMKPGIKQDVLYSVGNIMNNGTQNNSMDYNFASYKLNPDNFINQRA